MFVLGNRSRTMLNGVHPDLVWLAERAIQLTEVDFAVTDGVRTVEQQRALVARGASTTMNSRHLTGHAIDLVPWINGGLRWEWGPIYYVASAVQQAAKERGMKLRWGGVWDKAFEDLQAGPAGLEREVEAYVSRRRARGLRAFIDGPHYEIPA